jgi:hypothetical protein
MSPLTLAELRLQQAVLAHRAERLRTEWRTMQATGPRALSTGKRVKALQKRADDYASLLRIAEGTT